MRIVVLTKSVYGRDTVYPVCGKAKLLARLTGCKTLTPDALMVIRELGYSVVDQALAGRVSVLGVDTNPTMPSELIESWTD